MTAIDELHAASGLDWEELAELVGVSRHTLTLLSRGGAVHASTIARIEKVAGVVAGLGADTPRGRRAELYRHPGGGRSLFEQLLADARPVRTPLHLGVLQLYP